MSKRKLILSPGEPDGKPAPDQADDPKAILAQLERCLAGLDRLGAGIAAAHLSLAIEQARVAFNLAGNGSETD